MTEIVAAIEKVQQIIAKAGQDGFTEAKTVNVLVTPLLQSLGWHDVDTIDYEYATKGGGSVDIALIVAGKPKMFVEAKAYRASKTPLQQDKDALQAISYGAAEGVQWCLLTNGARYELYNTVIPLPLDQKLVFAVDLSCGAAAETVAKLALLTVQSLQDGRLDQQAACLLVEARVRGWLAEADPDLVSLVSKKLKGSVATKAVRLALQAVARTGGTAQRPAEPGHDPVPPPSHQPASEERSRGQLARRRPIAQSATCLTMWRVRETDGQLVHDAQVRVSEFPRLVSACVALAQRGEDIWTGPLQREAYGKVGSLGYWDAMETVSILHLLGALEHVGGINPQLFRLREGMTEEKIHGLLAQALEEDKDKSP